MEAILREIINYVIVFAGVIGLGFFSLNFLTKGFLLTYLRVKAGQGKKLLTRIHTSSDIYYRVGYFYEGFYKFKDRSGTEKSIPIQDVEFEKIIKHSMGVGLIEVNEEGNKLVSKTDLTLKLNAINQKLLEVQNTEVSDQFPIELKQEVISNLQESKYILEAEGITLTRSAFETIKLANIDPASLDSLVLRIKNRPRPNTQEQLKWFVRLAILGLCIMIMFKLINLGESLNALKTLSGNI